MSKVAVVYWSGTGNTESMANYVAEGVKENGNEVAVFETYSFQSDMMDEFDAVAFGCPSMGAEQLEDTEFEPLFNECKEKLAGKKIGLFGSYGWGDGEWMREWQSTCVEAGAELVSDGVICNGAPDDIAIEACTTLGKSL